MLFWKKKTPPLVQSSASAWREQWRAIVPPECRNVPITVDGRTFDPTDYPVARQGLGSPLYRFPSGSYTFEIR